MRKRMRLLAAVLSVGAALSACGGQGAPGVSAPPPLQAPVDEAPGAAVPPPPEPIELGSSPTIEEIKQRGKLIVGVRSDEPLFVERTGAGSYGGFDVEIARMIAEGMGVDPETGISYRRLPASLVLEAMSGGNVDVQLGGFDPAAPGVEAVGPYAVTGPPGTEQEHFIGMRPGDEVMRDEVRRILDEAVADGSWQRAYDATLGEAGVQARPLPG
ncbi:transporter substrate-binding domain-containing protein [Parasphingorhabdus pacifica]